MAVTCLSRTLDVADYVALRDELHYVTEQNIAQAEARRWEYALALHAIGRWAESYPLRRWAAPVYHIGQPEPQGPSLLYKATECETVVIDPVQLDDIDGRPLAPVVTALSVLQSVVNPEAVLYYCSCLLAPGGLLILTFPFWNRCGADTAVGHEHRRRIYCPKEYTVLRAQAATYLLTAFGGVDTTWHGTQVHDYSLASLVLEKRR
jgi:hypothetical protein